MKIHSKGITTKGDIDFEALSKICEEFNDGKINKKSYELQLESLQESLHEMKICLGKKEKESTKYSSDLLKNSHENEKLKEYLFM